MISPKVIDVDGNRILSIDFIGENNPNKKRHKYKLKLDKLYHGYNNEPNENYQDGRFPTQLFTNINEDKYKYIKII